MLVPLSTDSKEAGDTKQPLIPRGAAVPFFLVTALFFLWGVPSNLNDVLIRQFMKSFAISRFEAGLVQSAFYLGYFLLAIPAALLMRKMGYKFGIVVLFVIASGLSFLETASNPFVAQLGSPESAARRLNFSQAFNPLGAITGVLGGTVFIFSGIELTPAQVSAMESANTYDAYLKHETMRVVVPYLVLGVITLIWALLIARTKFPTIAREHEDSQDHGSFKELLRYPNFLFAIVAQFLYVGAQVGTWSYFIQYVQDGTHEPEKIAGYFLTGTLVAFGLGRFSSAALMRYVKPAHLMGAYSLVNIVLVAVGVAFPGWVGLWAIFVTSFFMSVMFPTIFALGIDGLDQNTKIGGSLIVMAIVGGAVLTPLMGWISQTQHSIAEAYMVPLFCYCGIALYSFVGVRMERRETLGGT
jgi:FHS family L-fucose permease-like MFS transporter